MRFIIFLVGPALIVPELIVAAPLGKDGTGIHVSGRDIVDLTSQGRIIRRMPPSRTASQPPQPQKKHRTTAKNKSPQDRAIQFALKVLVSNGLPEKRHKELENQLTGIFATIIEHGSVEETETLWQIMLAVLYGYLSKNKGSASSLTDLQVRKYVFGIFFTLYSRYYELSDGNIEKIWVGLFPEGPTFDVWSVDAGKLGMKLDVTIACYMDFVWTFKTTSAITRNLSQVKATPSAAVVRYYMLHYHKYHQNMPAPKIQTFNSLFSPFHRSIACMGFSRKVDYYSMLALRTPLRVHDSAKAYFEFYREVFLCSCWAEGEKKLTAKEWLGYMDVYDVKVEDEDDALAPYKARCTKIKELGHIPESWVVIKIIFAVLHLDFPSPNDTRIPTGM